MRLAGGRAESHGGSVQMERIPVFVHTDDPISQVGVAGQLRPRPEVLVLPAEEMANARVAVVVTDRVTEETLRVLRTVSRSGTARAVLVATQLDDADLVAAVESGAAGLVRRSEATPERLVSVINSAADREVEVLRLVADGLDTAEIAAKLAYSQRTVKNVLHDVTNRLQLRNRSHAVAYALR